MMVESKGQTIQIFLIDGKPDGMLTAKIMGQEGRVLKTPLAQISDALNHVKVSGYTGVYLLFGEKDGKPWAYIGESDNVGDRIRLHLQSVKMAWCDSVVLITAAENTIAKSHVKYLESRLIKRAKDVGKVTLENSNSPPLPGLGGKAEEANAESFLANILTILPAIRIDVFLDNTRPPSSSGAPLFELSRPKFGIQAIARSTNGEFVVQKGSLARAGWTTTPKQSQAYAGLHAEMVRAGILQKKGEHRVFKTSYAFKSSSAAASVVNGYFSNGSWWKVKGQKKTYYQWEIEKLAGSSIGKE